MGSDAEEHGEPRLSAVRRAWFSPVAVIAREPTPAGRSRRPARTGRAEIEERPEGQFVDGLEAILDGLGRRLG